MYRIYVTEDFSGPKLVAEPKFMYENEARFYCTELNKKYVGKIVFFYVWID